MKEIFKNNVYKTLELFIESPNKGFSIRGIARELNLSHVIVLRYVDELQKANLIRKKIDTLYPTFYANTESTEYKLYKKNYIVFKLVDSGLVSFIQKEVIPSSIVLFGSCAKADFTKNSDIDIFVEAKNVKLDLSKYEKKLKRKVNLLFETKINNLSKELRNNILNGIILYGFVRI